MVEVMHVHNVCHALPRGLEYLLEHGRREDSRAGRVLVAPCPVVTVTSHPCERVLFSSVRDANPFFHLFEALWMLAGRDDGQFLDQFVHDFSSRFGEDGGVIHGAYGYRWRYHFGFDQLREVISRLRSNPSDRQCVIQMWDASFTGADLTGSWRDRPCNTHVYLRVRETAEGTRYSQVLDMSVCCRSNDAVWGAHGANAVHFSILQEYIAAHIGVGVGTLVQFSHNYHVYETMLEELDKCDATHNFLDDNRYVGKTPVRTLPLIENAETWDEEISFILANPTRLRAIPFHNSFCRMVYAMRTAHVLYKKGFPEEAIRVLRGAAWCDWTVAGIEWMERRLAKSAVQRHAEHAR